MNSTGPIPVALLLVPLLAGCASLRSMTPVGGIPTPIRQIVLVLSPEGGLAEVEEEVVPRW